MKGIWEYAALSDDAKKELNLLYTADEINQQPETWLDTLNRIHNNKNHWKAWLLSGGLREETDIQIILTGAGTSYYVGVCLEPYWRQSLKRVCEAWPTTRIVAEPETVFTNRKNSLLVSFARSGDNPESIGAVTLAEQLVQKASHIAITCNKDSYLAKLEDSLSLAKSLVLDPRTLDKGLAMTSSFTNLVVAGLVLAGLVAREDIVTLVNNLATLADRVIAQSPEIMAITQDNDFDRTFIFGDGSQYGAALEGVLKFEEFSDGAIVGLAQGFLGARHGYANVINDQTLAIFLLASDPYVRQYQMEVIEELATRRPTTKKLAISLHPDQELKQLVDYLVVLDHTRMITIPDTWRAPLDMVVLQCLGLQAALKLGVPPDQPFRHRATARAIEGLKLHPYTRGQ